MGLLGPSLPYYEEDRGNMARECNKYGIALHLELGCYNPLDDAKYGTMHYGLQLFSSSTHIWVHILMRIGLGVPLLGDPRQEAEYRGVSNAVAETCWLRNLSRELDTPLSSATLVYCDNVSAVYLSCNPVQHQCTKHIEIDIHFVRDLVRDTFEYFMCLLDISLQTFSPRVYRQHCLKNFAPV
nr:ribonuclease H-like domain-containing protein [Tanacetum cinerariifolium]